MRAILTERRRPLQLASPCENHAVLAFTSRKVSALTRKRDVAALVETLRTGSARDRRAAANALITIPDQRAIDPLIEALRADDWLLRTNAALALGEFQDARPGGDTRRIVEPLTRALNDLQPGVRAAAASALGRMHDPAAVDGLIAALDDEDRTVAKMAALVLRDFDDDRAREALAAL
jgi:HEAT repeat protein